MTEFTPRQRLFIREYLVDLNGTKAAIRAGYSENGASVRAAQLLGDSRIFSEIEKHKDKRSEKTGITAERVLRELERISFFDQRKLYHDGGKMKHPTEWDDDTAAVVSGLKVTEEFAGKGDERECIGFTKEVKLWDKVSGLDKLAKHLGLYERDNAQRAPNLAMQIVYSGPT